MLKYQVEIAWLYDKSYDLGIIIKRAVKYSLILFNVHVITSIVYHILYNIYHILYNI